MFPNPKNICNLHIHLTFCLFFFHVETTLNNGKQPSMGELYLHTHSRRADGKSPVVVQIQSAITNVSEPNENTDGNGVSDPSMDEPSTQVVDYDINSLRFTNSDAKAVYVSCII